MNRLYMLLKNFQKLQLDNRLFIRLARCALFLNCARGKQMTLDISGTEIR